MKRSEMKTVYLVLQTQPSEGYVEYPFAAFETLSEAKQCRDYYQTKHSDTSLYEIAEVSEDKLEGNDTEPDVPLWESWEEYVQVIEP